jgi:hypothetical protein
MKRVAHGEPEIKKVVFLNGNGLFDLAGMISFGKNIILANQKIAQVLQRDEILSRGIM